MDQATLYITIALFSIILLVILDIFYTIFKTIKQTKEAIKEIERQFAQKLAIFSRIITEVIKYVAFEKALVEEIKNAKRKAEAAKTVEEKEEAGNLLSNVLNSVFKVSEKYPDLKVSEQLAGLKQQLKEIEEGIESSKRLYKKGKNVLKNIIGKLPFNFNKRKTGPIEGDSEDMEEVAAKESNPNKIIAKKIAKKKIVLKNNKSKK
ncbi:MAG: LemA family protein [Candidatus Paceibacterota bacterium]